MDGRWKQKRVNCWPLCTSALETPSARPGPRKSMHPLALPSLRDLARREGGGRRRGQLEERVSETSGYCIMYFEPPLTLTLFHLPLLSRASFPSPTVPPSPLYFHAFFFFFLHVLLPRLSRGINSSKIVVSILPPLF